MGISQKLYLKAKEIIPGGTQLLSKRPEMFLPNEWPAYYKKAKGCNIWDLDERKYIDMSSMGIGSCILGYADPDVNRAVKDVINKGSMTTLNCPEEVELAKLLCDLHPWAQMVRYARCGGEAMAVAVRIARAKTKKDVVLFCGYHGWHDWYLSTNLADNKALDGHLLPGLNPLGVPRGLINTAIPFKFNDVEGFLRLVKKYKNKIGAIVLEPVKNYFPDKKFLETISDTSKKIQIPLVVDEVSSGWRMNLGGVHLLIGLEPDIAVFAKAMSNGFPMAAIIGKSKVMDVAQDTFISSTYWTERIGPTAALATIKKMKKNHVQKHLANVGAQVQNGWQVLADKYSLKIKITGMPSMSHFEFLNDKPLVCKTLLTQSLLNDGFLGATLYYASYAHKTSHVNKYLQAIDRAFKFIKEGLDNNSLEEYLNGPVCHAGFKRLN